jgi:hypothetical protein
MRIHEAGRPREKRCALIQAVVTPTVAAWVLERARAEDRSVTDYLRRLIEMEMRLCATDTQAAGTARGGAR